QLIECACAIKIKTNQHSVVVFVATGTVPEDMECCRIAFYRLIRIQTFQINISHPCIVSGQKAFARRVVRLLLPEGLRPEEPLLIVVARLMQVAEKRFDTTQSLIRF